MHLKVVPVEDIPSAIVNPPDDLKELYILCSAMQELCVAEHGVGLSATQVGIPWRLFIATNIKDSKFRYFINCDCTPIGDGLISSIEGCLSLKREDGEFRRFKVNRYREIRFSGKELLVDDQLKLVDVDETHEGFAAVILQHEIGHQSGITIDKIGQEIFLY